MSRFKIYTKTGDDGTTGLLSGKRVSKHHVRIKAYGTVDELNAWIGMIRNFELDDHIQNTLIKIQQELMTMASQLADDSAFEVSKLIKILQPIDQRNVKNLEDQIDLINSELPELKNFVIPGGHVLISYSHLARCVCRRAERYVTELDEEASISSTLIAYMNRLSDYFFTLSRTFAAELNVEEVKWSGN